MADKKKRVDSPIGNLMYVMITGQGKENYEGDGYEYQACVDVPDSDADAFIDEIEDFIEDNASQKGSRALNKKGNEVAPYTTHDEDDNIPEGYVRFNFKTKTEFEDAKGKVKDTIVDILDANGNKVKLPEGKLIGNESTGRAIGQLVYWERGKRDKIEYAAALYLNKVQIKDFIPYEGETIEAIEGGSFNGFDNELEPTEEDTPAEESTRKRRPRRKR